MGSHSRSEELPMNFRSLTSFYADPVRKRSPERDVGLYWRDGDDRRTYRAAWLRATGELVIVRHGPINQGGGIVEVLCVVSPESELDELVDGWEDVCGEPGSLDWLRGRV